MDWAEWHFRVTLDNIIHFGLDEKKWKNYHRPFHWTDKYDWKCIARIVFNFDTNPYFCSSFFQKKVYLIHCLKALINWTCIQTSFMEYSFWKQLCCELFLEQNQKLKENLSKQFF